MDENEAEFINNEFENGEGMALCGWPLADCLEQIARELGRPLTDDEKSQFCFGWHVGRADYEAAREREAERQRRNEPEPQIDWSEIPY